MEIKINDELIEIIRDETQELLFTSKWATFSDMKELNKALNDLKNLKITVSL
jgi:hypothetical protein